jgi:hypothetical protein
MDPNLAVLKTYVVGQASLGYTTFASGPKPSDIILVTYPKSGSTWTSYLLHQLRSDGDEKFDDIKNEVIDITPGHWDPKENPFTIEQRFSPRTFKTHGRHTLAPKGGKFIYIARNPKDVFLSLYHFLHDLFDFEEKIDMSEFYRHYFVERFGTDHDISNIWQHILSWHPHRCDENFLWLHYEDLLEDRRECLQAIAQFMDLKLSDDQIELVLNHSTMDYTRKLSNQLNPSQSNKVGQVTLTFGEDMKRYARNLQFGKMRNGISGEGNTALPKPILEQLHQEWQKRITPILGYKNYGEMRSTCSLFKQTQTLNIVHQTKWTYLNS